MVRPAPHAQVTSLIVAITGLTAGEARPGAHASIGYSIIPDTGAQVVRWGTSPGDASYGSGSAPSDFASGDGGLLWLTVTVGSDTVARAAPIRHAAPLAAGALPDVTIVAGNTGAIATAWDFAFSGTRRFALAAGPAGLMIDAATGAITAGSVASSGAFTVVVRLEDANDSSRFAESAFTLTVEDFTLTGTADGEIEIIGATGQVTITVTAPSDYAIYDAGNGPGVFVLNVADLATGPASLVPPRIIHDGSPAAGETLTIIPGLWVYDADAGGLTPPAYQWQANAVDIVAATSTSYVLTAADSGRNIRVRESLADARGARAATSAAVAIPGGGTVFSDDFSANTTASYSATGWEIVAGQARMIGLTGQVAAIIPVPDPALSADHFVRGTLGTLGTGTNVLRLRAKMALNWGSSFSNVSANIRADGRLIMQINGTDVATHIVSGGFSVGDTIELRITGGGTLATILRNGVVPNAAFQNVDVSTVAASSRVAFGLQGGWHLDRFEAGNI